MCVCVCILKYIIMTCSVHLYNVTCMYVLRADHFVLDNQLVRKTIFLLLTFFSCP